MLVIFDCDGVLVDSEALAARVFSEQLARIGLRFSPAQCLHHFRGRSLDDCCRWLATHFSVTLPSTFRRELDRATARAFANTIQPVRGIEEVLKLLQQRGVPFCVASNGSHEKIARSLQLTGLSAYFESRCYSVEDVAAGKPAPDLFLFAAESMGVPPAFCWVVEDSSAGVRAALAANMRVLAYNLDPQQEHAPVDDVAGHGSVKLISELAQIPVQLQLSGSNE